jgi:hypothetical protein
MLPTCRWRTTAPVGFTIEKTTPPFVGSVFAHVPEGQKPPQITSCVSKRKRVRW